MWYRSICRLVVKCRLHYRAWILFMTAVTMLTLMKRNSESIVIVPINMDSSLITNVHTQFSKQPYTPLPDDVTIVTGYINIGQFPKGHDDVRKPHQYNEWMEAFRFISNPVIAYFGNEKDMQRFSALRNSSGFTQNTYVKLIDKNSMWTFSLKANVTRIYDTPNYPKHYPNTVYPEYACAVNGKYELLQYGIIENPFKTQYFAWMDFGYFRELDVETCPKFKIALPPKFNRSNVCYNRVYQPFNYTMKDIFFDNRDWIGGGMIVGEAGILKNWTREFLTFIKYFVAHNLMSADQQILYAAYAHLKPKTRLQLYGCSKEECEKWKLNKWFYLGYLSTYPVVLPDPRKLPRKKKNVHVFQRFFKYIGLH